MAQALAALTGAGLASAAVAAACPAPPPVQPSARAVPAGALGDGRQDDTRALQAAIDATPPNGVLYLPAGTYRIAVGRAPDAGLRLKSDMTLVMHPDAVLKALPTADGLSAVLKAWGVSNVRIFGGTLAGERHEHLGHAGEWGMGLDIRDAVGVTVVGTVARDAWGDGFYVGGRTNRDLHFCGVTAEGNRRNGLSVVAGRHITVHASRFLRSAGTPPQAGLDIEPDRDQATEDVVVTDSVASGNAGAGISLGAACADCTAINRRNTLRGNTVSRNGGHGLHVAFGGHVVERNTVEDSGRAGILLWRAEDAIVRGNTVRRSKLSGLQLEGSRGNRIDGNRFEGHAVSVLLKAGSRDNDLAANACDGPEQPGRPAAIRQDVGSTANRLADNAGCGGG